MLAAEKRRLCVVCASTQFGRRARVSVKLRQSLAQRRFVGAGDQPGAPAITDHVGHTAHRGGDDGQPCRHGFQESQGKSLGAR